MKIDLFWFFVVRNSQQHLEIRAVCSHCFLSAWFNYAQTVQNIEETLDRHECSATPLSSPVNLEVIK